MCQSRAGGGGLQVVVVVLCKRMLLGRERGIRCKECSLQGGTVSVVHCTGRGHGGGVGGGSGVQTGSRDGVQHVHWQCTGHSAGIQHTAHTDILSHGELSGGGKDGKQRRDSRDSRDSTYRAASSADVTAPVVAVSGGVGGSGG